MILCRLHLPYDKAYHNDFLILRLPTRASCLNGDNSPYTLIGEMSAITWCLGMMGQRSDKTFIGIQSIIDHVLLLVDIESCRLSATSRWLFYYTTVQASWTASPPKHNPPLHAMNEFG